MKTWKLIPALAALAIAASAATPNTALAQTAEASKAYSPRTYVRVVNNNWLDVNVYAVSGGRSRRLGTVTSFNKAEFVLPASVLSGAGDITLVTDPIGSRVVNVSNIVAFSPGDVIELSVENALPLTNARIIGTTVGDGIAQDD